MKIQLKKFSALNSEEMKFIYCMLRKYGEMEEAKERNISKKTKKKFKSNNRRPKPKPKVRKDSQYPDLYDFSDPKWEKCTDEKFLAYREIMERAGD